MLDRIKKIIELSELTRRDFALKIGVDPSAFYSMLNGGRKISDRTIALIASRFNVSEEWIRNGSGSMFKSKERITDADITRRHILDLYSKLPRELQEELEKLSSEILRKAKEVRTTFPQKIAIIGDNNTDIEINQ
ncbi:MAG: helix-turn-helix transcriptional regulator [Thermoguttaceae bacterium]|nr:helix-turn-helix transcriptional regulator [Thermoguttaceae bacterium]